MNGAGSHVGLDGHMKDSGFCFACNRKPLQSRELSNDIIYCIPIGSIVTMRRTDISRVRVQLVDLRGGRCCIPGERHMVHLEQDSGNDE